MTSKSSSLYALEWGLGAIKLKSKRSLGNLRNRITANFRSENKSFSNFHSDVSLEEFFCPYPTEEDYKHYPYRPSTSSTMMTGKEPDIPEEPLKEAEELEAERSAQGSPGKSESPSAYSTSNGEASPSYDIGNGYAIQPLKPRPISIAQIREERRPDCSVSHKLSLSLTGAIERPMTLENRYSRSSLMQEHSGKCVSFTECVSNADFFF
jgi:hypothetical protein